MKIESSVRKCHKRIMHSLYESFEYHHLAIARSNRFLRKHDSEKMEWEEYYEIKSRKRGNEDGKDEELLRSESQANVDVEMEDVI